MQFLEEKVLKYDLMEQNQMTHEEVSMRCAGSLIEMLAVRAKACKAMQCSWNNSIRLRGLLVKRIKRKQIAMEAQLKTKVRMLRTGQAGCRTIVKNTRMEIQTIRRHLTRSKENGAKIEFIIQKRHVKSSIAKVYLKTVDERMAELKRMRVREQCKNPSIFNFEELPLINLKLILENCRFNEFSALCSLSSKLRILAEGNRNIEHPPCEVTILLDENGIVKVTAVPIYFDYVMSDDTFTVAEDQLEEDLGVCVLEKRQISLVLNTDDLTEKNVLAIANLLQKTTVLQIKMSGTIDDWFGELVRMLKVKRVLFENCSRIPEYSFSLPGVTYFEAVDAFHQGKPTAESMGFLHKNPSLHTMRINMNRALEFSLMRMLDEWVERRRQITLWIIHKDKFEEKVSKIMTRDSDTKCLKIDYYPEIATKIITEVDADEVELVESETEEEGDSDENDEDEEEEEDFEDDFEDDEDETDEDEEEADEDEEEDEEEEEEEENDTEANEDKVN